MKYFGFLFFTICSIWTWKVIHDLPDVAFETHVGIQEKLSEMIVDTVRSKKPDVSDVQVTKIWTESKEGGKVVAHFTYSFKENSAQAGSTLSSIEGEGFLDRTDKNPLTGDEKWTLTKVQIRGDTVKFDEGLVILSNSATQ